MVCFMSKVEDTAIIKLICGEQSRMNAAVNGADFINIDGIVNDANNDDKIKHIGIALSYYNDEDKLTSKIKNNYSATPIQNNIKPNKTQKKNNTKEEAVEDWTCPECGSNECLKDRQGTKYPCLSCLQIDIGQKILRQFTDKITNSIDINNKVIESFVDFLKRGKDEYDSSRSN